MTQRNKSEGKDPTSAPDETKEPGKKSQEIESEIGQTRSAISEDIKVLSDKLSPSHLKDEAKQAIGEAKDKAVEKVIETKDAVVEKAVELKDATVEKAVELKDKAGEKVQEVEETIEDAAQEVSYQARRAGRATWSFTVENAVPLAMIGIGAGWIISNTRGGSGGRDAQYGYEDDSRRALEGDYPYGDRGYGSRRPGPRRYADEAFREEPSTRPYAGSGRAREFEAPSSSARMPASGRSADLIASGRAGTGNGNGSKRGASVSDKGQALYRRAERSVIDAEHALAAGAAHTADELKSSMRRTRDRLETSARQARDATREFAEDNPLAVALATLVAGIGVGLLLPRSQREDQLLRPVRERVGRFVDEAKQAAEEMGDAARETAQQTAQALR